jgi:hypothetical protein
MPVPPQLLSDVLPPLPRGGFTTALLDAESSGNPAGLLEPGGVGTCNYNPMSSAYQHSADNNSRKTETALTQNKMTMEVVCPH